MEASIVSLAGYRDRQGEQAFRARVHAQVEAFLDQWEAQMADRSPLPSLLDLSEGVRQERAALTGSMVQA